MDEKSTEGLVHDLGTLFRFGSAVGLTDRQLLDRFVEGGNAAEAAFEGIVRRHGPMVLGVCRRALGDVHTAEDVFQATFLVLAFRARAITRRDSVAPWLHGVASRLARRTRVLARRRPELSCALPEVISPEADGDMADLRPVFDEELGRLPEKYHRPLVLCYLEGLTQEEAAQVLGWTKGTVSGRLARAKVLLRARLTRRGLAPAVGLLASGTAVGGEAAALAVPPSLVGATTRAAVSVTLGLAETGAVSGSVIALARGGLRSMIVGRLKAAAILLLLGALGSAVAIGYAGTEDPPAARGAALAVAVAAARSIDRPLPEGARVRMGTTRLRHEGNVVRALFSPDGRTLATAGWDKAVRFWDFKTGETIPGLDLLKESSSPLAVDYSPDGHFLAVGREDGTVQLWDATAKRERFRSKLPGGRVRGIAFAPDGTTFASSSSDDKCVRLWDVATGRELQSLEFRDEQDDHCGPVAFSPDGHRLALGMEPKTGERVMLRIWDLRDRGKPVVFRAAHDFLLAGIAFTKDSKELISGGLVDRHVQEDAIRKKWGRVIPVAKLTRWDVRNGQKLGEMDSGEILGLGGFALVLDGSTLVSAHHDRLLVWDIASSRVTRTILFPPDDLDSGGGASGIAIAPDDRTIALLRNDHRIRVLDFASGKSLPAPTKSHSDSVLAVTFTPEGRTLASASADGTIRIWDTANGEPRRQFDLTERGWARAVCVSPDGRLMAAVGEDPNSDTPYFGGIARLWDLSDGRLLRELRFDHRATLVSFSADSRRVAVATWNAEATLGMGGKNDGPPDDTVRVFDADTGQRLAELRGHDSRIVAFAFAPDGRSFVTASQDTSFRFWESDSGQPIRQFDLTSHFGKGKPYRIANAAIAPDLTWALTSGERDHRLIVWDLKSGKALRTIEDEPNVGTRVAISPDGRRFCSVTTLRNSLPAGSDRIRLWDMASGRELLSLATQGKPISSLAFAPDGKSMATGMADTTAIIWDLGTDIRGGVDRGKP
ncbi:RNA polymerase sigma factor, sigma-70 family [Singulisphaera sp. GP187]|uniref:sigma-70 family RNA polymerase sigma factor n=1 Tax=Singulisphaera sp. GP187 TaxID=1882752 RepID=UPI000927759D|nr:sigma-70 family RNA polymerase sigma factor [Singulisphaera sp. GP187]SIO65102.1 RNA polymerase sigma factor, sigma-70 family [Singulisphaera sp. GP187]